MDIQKRQHPLGSIKSEVSQKVKVSQGQLYEMVVLNYIASKKVDK